MIDEQRKCIICGGEVVVVFAPPTPPTRCVKCIENNALWIEPIPMADWEGDMVNHPTWPPLHFDGSSFYMAAPTIYGLSKTTFPYVTGSGAIPPTGTFYIAGKGAFAQ